MTSKASTGCSDREVRCGCGSLVARRTAGGIEIKCRRCKRIVLVVPEAVDDAR
jgi:phage FluMu protein Com